MWPLLGSQGVFSSLWQYGQIAALVTEKVEDEVSDAPSLADEVLKEVEARSSKIV